MFNHESLGVIAFLLGSSHHTWGNSFLEQRYGPWARRSIPSSSTWSRSTLLTNKGKAVLSEPW